MAKHAKPQEAWVEGEPSSLGRHAASNVNLSSLDARFAEAADDRPRDGWSPRPPGKTKLPTSRSARTFDGFGGSGVLSASDEASMF